LFRTYCELPYDEILTNFAQVYNDVFYKEKPITVQKYYLCQVAVAELTSFSPDMKMICSFNFTQDTSRELNYHQSEEVKAFLRKAVRLVKKSDMGVYEQPYKKKNDNAQQDYTLQNGLEFFYSNVMMKVYQVPVMFTQSSEDSNPLNDDSVGSFIVMFFEKMVRKRTYAKTVT